MAAESRIEVWDGCAAVVAAAVETFCARWDRYSTKSVSHSIFRLFEELIDPAFSTYLSTLPEHHRGRGIVPNISVAKLARHGGFGLAEDVIRACLLQFMKTSGQYDIEFERTIETLIVVARRCKTKRPKRLSSGRANRLYSEYCDFCGAHTELAAQQKGDTRPGYDREGAARLSAKYCWSHRPKFLDGSRNHEYLWAARHKHEFEIELKRLSLQAKAISKPNAETGNSDLDLFYFKLLSPLAVYPSDICFLRNEARRLIDLRVSDKKKRIVMMRTEHYTLAAIAKEVGAKSRQAVAKSLASTPKRYRFDLANHATSHRNIDTMTSVASKVGQSKADSAAQARFMSLIGPVATMAFQDSDISEILLNDDGTLWCDSRSTGMKTIGFISALDAAQIIQFAAQNFSKEQESGKEVILVKLPFANARFTGVLSPVVDSPVFCIRKGSH